VIGGLLARIGLDGPVRPDAAGLRAVHLAFALSVPFENLDVQLGVPVTRDPRDACRKVVERRRGGWCYELNGLLAAALEILGFRVERLSAAVMREALGDGAVGNHLALLVHLPDGPVLADVGFGDGPVEPVPLRPGPFRNGFFRCALKRLPDGWWRYRNDPRGGAPGFDFREGLHDDALMEAQSRRQQTDPASGFVRTATARRWTTDGLLALKGGTLRTVTGDDVRTEDVPDAAAYASAMRDRFGLEVEGADALWARIAARRTAG